MNVLHCVSGFLTNLVFRLQQIFDTAPAALKILLASKVVKSGTSEKSCFVQSKSLTQFVDRIAKYLSVFEKNRLGASLNLFTVVESPILILLQLWYNSSFCLCLWIEHADM